jgi:hypothetical protein
MDLSEDRMRLIDLASGTGYYYEFHSLEDADNFLVGVPGSYRMIQGGNDGPPSGWSNDGGLTLELANPEAGDPLGGRITRPDGTHPYHNDEAAFTLHGAWQSGGRACVYESSVTLPPALAAIGNADAIQEYTEFTCSRNLPHCVDGEMNEDDCLAACEAVSNKIAAYSAECLALEADEEWAIDAALNLTNATNSTNSTFPKTFECFTLGGSRSLPAGYDADGNRLGNGCVEPWCHQPHPSGPEGTGPPGSPQYQGWQRDCEQLCGEAEADLLDVVAGVTEACVDDVTDMEPCDTSTFAAGTVVRSAAEANCGAGCAYTAYAAPMVTDTRTQTSTQTSTTNLNDRFANSSRSSPSRISSAGVATPALAMLAIVALTRWRVV